MIHLLKMHSNMKEPEKYPGWVVRPEAGSKVIFGYLQIQSEAITFEANGLRASIPLEALLMERDAQGDLRLSHALQPATVLFTREESFLDHPFLRSNRHVAALLAPIRKPGRKKPWIILGAITALLLVLLGAFIWAGSRWAVDWLVNKIPLEWEQKLGQQVLSQLNAELKTSRDPASLEFVQKVASYVEKGLPEPRPSFQFVLVENKDPNAAALPGGTVLVHTGLLTWIESPEELAGVLAHEMAHVLRRHGLRQIVHAVGTYALLSLFVSDQNGFLTALGDGSRLLLRQGYSRHYEREADTLAWQYLRQAGLNPSGLHRFLQRLATHPQLGTDSGPALLRSHPPTADRLAWLREQEKKLPPDRNILVLSNHVSMPFPVEEVKSIN